MWDPLLSLGTPYPDLPQPLDLLRIRDPVLTPRFQFETPFMFFEKPPLKHYIKFLEFLKRYGISQWEKAMYALDIIFLW